MTVENYMQLVIGYTLAKTTESSQKCGKKEQNFNIYVASEVNPFKAIFQVFLPHKRTQ